MRVWVQLPLSLSCQKMTVACISSTPNAQTIRVKTWTWQNQLPALRLGLSVGSELVKRKNHHSRRSEHINLNQQQSRALLLKESELVPNYPPQSPFLTPANELMCKAIPAKLKSIYLLLGFSPPVEMEVSLSQLPAKAFSRNQNSKIGNSLNHQVHISYT